MNKKPDLQRRRFLKTCSCLASAYAMGGVSTQVYSASDNYSGPLWLFVNAEGGWDVTALCDPKGYAGPLDTDNPQRLNNYDQAAIMQAGNIRFAPPPDSFQPGGIYYDASLYSAQMFFNKYYQRLLVINGIDCNTNIHADGQQLNLAGELRDGFPCFTALLAGVLAPERTLSFLTYGGYSNSGGLLTPVRMSNSTLNALFEIAFPNRSNNPKSADSRLYLPDDIQRLIHETSQMRHQALLQQQGLVRARNAIQKLIATRQQPASLGYFAESLLNNPARPLSSFNGRKKAHALYLQGRTVLSAYHQGLTAGANIIMNGFDTHAKHDQNHYPLLMDLLQGIDAIIDEAEVLGIADRLVLVITSDFSRTPAYNQQEGKDHWPVSSVLLMGNSQQKITGNRVIGASSSQFEAIAVDPVSLVPDYGNTNPMAIKLRPSHIHRALRILAGIDTHPVSQLFPLDAAGLRLFS